MEVGTDGSAQPRLYRSPALPAGVEEGWRSLVAADPDGSWFMTPDWVLAWWETLGAGLAPGAAEIAVWQGPGGAVEAVVPLLRTRLRLHPRAPVSVPCVTLLGSGPGAADHCGLPALPGRRADVREWLARRSRGASLWLPNVDPAQTGPLPAGLRTVERFRCPRADLSAGVDALGSRQFRAAVRRYGRKLAAARVDFRWVPPGEAGPELLDEVMRLHLLRRAALGRPTTFDAARRPLHHRLLERAAAGRGPALLIASSGGQVVGGLYGFLWGDTFSYYQIGWDPAWAPLRLGTAVIAEAMRACAERGVRTFDFLRGTEGYKYRFGAVDRDDLGLLLPRGTGGALLVLRQRARARRAAGAPAVDG
ncbi:GNAT family N-acetyltransferase [Peterkaempfera griseoplana]|uniref:GNAT family N-acetyltransferase n=1 Tax=Peterkaempfera griseoplana TaxID=66896 RepID=UPI0006E406ED|nr:GNAT family N-acetyltransferase [Peterkaempfera griseoplana]